MLPVKMITTCLDMVLGIFSLGVALDKNKTARVGGILMLIGIILSIICIWFN